MQSELFAQLPQLIGATRTGGTNNYGIFYKTNFDGSSFTPIYSFGYMGQHPDIESYNYAGKSLLTYSYNDTLNNFKTEGFKISFASTFQVNFTGISKDSINNKCNIILGVLSSNLDLPYSVYS